MVHLNGAEQVMVAVGGTVIGMIALIVVWEHTTRARLPKLCARCQRAATLRPLTIVPKTTQHGGRAS